MSSLIYASTRCGEFPELLEMRAVFVSRFGKEFAARAMELRNNCRVNIKVMYIHFNIQALELVCEVCEA